MANELYWNELAVQINFVFEDNDHLYDHRREYPWLTGALGNPQSGIWFIAENPSLIQIGHVQNPDGRVPTPEAQWWSSRGDKLFRDMLVNYSFKNGTIDSLGGWNCYITNVVKEVDYVNRWRNKNQDLRNQAAEIWSSVLSWELENSKPIFAVVLGGAATSLLEYLQSKDLINLPPLLTVKHYAYIGQRAEGRLGPMHPERISRYSEDFARIRKKFDYLSSLH